ncbi:hypothetical protein J6N69_03935 [bacterium]|nr:hypothetical protein [bacterium]
MTIITNNNGQTYQTAGIGTTTGAVLAGMLANNAIVNINARAVSPKIMKKLEKQSSELNETQVAEIQKGIKDAFEKSDLKQKGVDILDVRELKDGEELTPASKKLIESITKKIEKYIPEKIRKSKVFAPKLEFIKKNLQNTIEDGKNAAYFEETNKIAINTEKLGVSAFHEMGHALNMRSSKFWKVIQKARPVALLSGVFGLTALLKRKKIEGEEPKNNFDKVTTFIKNNVGKLAVLSFVPLIAEELAASYKGEKLAKQVLSPELLKKVKNCNRLGASTYILMAGAVGLGAVVASKVRDAIAKPEEI